MTRALAFEVRATQCPAVTSDTLAAEPAPAPPARFALAAHGFRPFFLLAGLYAAVSLPIWLVALAGRFDPESRFGRDYWHGHEMLFGFTVAVIAGFLITAAANWTKRKTITGAPLMAVAGVWLAGRVVMFTGSALPPLVVSVVDLAFLPLVVLAMAVVVIPARDKRNYLLLVILSLLFVANLLMHLGRTGQGAFMAMDLILTVITVISSRIIPLFTRNTTKVEGIKNLPVFDWITIGGMIGLALADAAAAPLAVVGVLSGVVALSSIVRVRYWGAQHSLRVPMLWVLHVGHAWVIIGLLLRFASWLTPSIPATAAVHAFTTGAIATLTLGVMARVSRGHTGRKIVAAPLTTVYFVMITLAAISRAVASIVSGPSYLGQLMLSGTLFALAFLLFVIDCAPMLVLSRADGKPG